MMSLAIFICLFTGFFLIFMGLRAHTVSQTRKLPPSYKILYFVLYVCYVVMALLLAKQIVHTEILRDSMNNIGLGYVIIASLMIALIFACTFMMVEVMFNTNDSIRKISLEAALFNLFTKKEDKEYQQIDVETFAEKNHLDYVSVITGNRIENDDDDIERIIAKDNKYIKLYPYNDGYNYSPKKQWFGKFEKDGVVYYAMIMDTKKAFSCITNLKEILMQMIQLYWDSVENDVFMDPYEFGLMLEGKVTEGYVGRAKLLITADTIKNRKIEVDERERARKYYLNRFLDCFIGWNFGVIISEDVELQIRLNQLNEYVIQKGLRTDKRIGTNLDFSDYIQKYRLKRE